MKEINLFGYRNPGARNVVVEIPFAVKKKMAARNEKASKAAAVTMLN